MPNYFSNLTSCYSQCPSGLIGDVYSMTCVNTSNYYVNMTLKLTNPSISQILIQISFTEKIDFSIFPYKNFQTISF
jgi:hypothetical protein